MPPCSWERLETKDWREALMTETLLGKSWYISLRPILIPTSISQSSVASSMKSPLMTAWKSVEGFKCVLGHAFAQQ